MDGLIIDCFAGGGGASKDIEMALNRPIDIAVNHDPEAIRIHKANHPPPKEKLQTKLLFFFYIFSFSLFLLINNNLN